MNVRKLREKIAEILGDKVYFNDDFDFYARGLKVEMKISLIDWCVYCKEGRLRGQTPLKEKMKNLYVFFKKIGNDTRAILVKVKNSDFIELHLVRHKEYDDIRKKFGFKKSSYYRS